MPQPSLSTYHPSLGERLQQGFAGLLGKVGVDPRYANHLGSRIFGALNDLTPVGNATMAADAGAMIRSGHPLKGAGMGALAVLPGPAAKLVGRGGMFAARKGIKAYHGSPHDFDKFSLSKIGSGEGSQVFGHGIYLSEHPDVARTYQRELAKSGNGRFYEVAFNADPNSLLNWDAPLVEQAAGRKLIKRFGLPEKSVRMTERGWFDDLPLDGAEAYKAIARREGDWAAASDALRRSGVPGVNYWDAFSRGPQTGTRNYVAFDDSLIDILNKY